MDTTIIDKEDISSIQECENITEKNDNDTEFLRKINFIALRRKMLLGE